jgi:hypothetical protein
VEISADLTKSSYCITVPCYDEMVTSPTCMSLLETSQKLIELNVKHSFAIVRGGALIHQVRNELTHKFLHETDCDTMVCIDSDVSWEWEAMQRLLVFSQMYPIVAGVYCLRKDPPAFFVNGFGGVETMNEHGLVPSTGTGMGFVAITRKAFEAIPAPTYFSPQYPEKPMKAYFQTGLVGNRSYGEDIWFFTEAQKVGIPCMLDPGIELLHHGKKAYDYKFRDTFTT